MYTQMAMGGSALQPHIRKFQFSLSVSIQMSSKDVKVGNM